MFILHIVVGRDMVSNYSSPHYPMIYTATAEGSGVMSSILYGAAVASTALIIVMMMVQAVLVVGALLHRRRTQRERAMPLPGPGHYPPLTILVPAHNEAVVIEKTVKTLLALRYPKDKLTLMVINDASTDDTGAILDRLHAVNPHVVVYHREKPEGGRGKAAALNAAVERVEDEFIAIYDADNCPEPDSLLMLMARFLRNPALAAAVGKFRCGNKHVNFLTRCVNVEGLCFQGIVQAGRHRLLDIAFLTGTNYVIRKSALRAVGGWDHEALAEDSELSTRLYMAGYRIDYVPYSQSWEQEPETLKVWLKQRTRWARGNNYAIVKLMRHFGQSRDKLRTAENAFMLVMSYFYLVAIVISQVALLVSLCGVACPFYGPGWLEDFWLLSAVFYVLQVILVLIQEREAHPLNLLAGGTMYFFYGYLWMVAILRALHHDVVVKKARHWDKTVRYETELEMGEQA